LEALILTAFVSVVLVLGAILFFCWNVRQRSHEHSERLALLPLADDFQPPAEPDFSERKPHGD